MKNIRKVKIRTAQIVEVTEFQKMQNSPPEVGFGNRWSYSSHKYPSYLFC